LTDQLQLGDKDSLVTLKKAWEKALKLLSPEINRPSFESFFVTAKPISLEQNHAVIGAAGELAKIFLEKYCEHIRTALEPYLEPGLELSFTVVQKERPAARTPEPRTTAKTIGGISSISLPLNEKFTFENFVVGPANRMAFAIAKGVADKPGKAYNPVFLYGGPGLGKTHLLQAIGRHVLSAHPGLTIAYISGEQFTDHYVTSLRQHRSEDFRRKYRGIDLWLVDDIQFLVGKEKTKEEFFHTFNALQQMNKQIVLSSDRSPRDLNPMEERLKSRFQAGVMIDVAPPDLETRIAILQNKASQENVHFSLDISECIATLVPTNIRALEGALVTLIAYSSLMKIPLSVSLVHQVLGRYLSEKKVAELSPDAIQRAVAKAFNVDLAGMIGDKRVKELVTARHIAIYLCREMTECTLSAIGRAFGRNHASIVHAYNHAKELLEKDESLKNVVDAIIETLKTGVV